MGIRSRLGLTSRGFPFGVETRLYMLMSSISSFFGGVLVLALANSPELLVVVYAVAFTLSLLLLWVAGLLKKEELGEGSKQLTPPTHRVGGEKENPAGIAAGDSRSQREATHGQPGHLPLPDRLGVLGGILAGGASASLYTMFFVVRGIDPPLAMAVGLVSFLLLSYMLVVVWGVLEKNYYPLATLIPLLLLHPIETLILLGSTTALLLVIRETGRLVPLLYPPALSTATLSTIPITLALLTLPP